MTLSPCKIAKGVVIHVEKASGPGKTKELFLSNFSVIDTKDNFLRIDGTNVVIISLSNCSKTKEKSYSSERLMDKSFYV